MHPVHPALATLMVMFCPALSACVSVSNYYFDLQYIFTGVVYLDKEVTIKFVSDSDPDVTSLGGGVRVLLCVGRCSP